MFVAWYWAIVPKAINTSRYKRKVIEECRKIMTGKRGKNSFNIARTNVTKRQTR